MRTLEELALIANNNGKPNNQWRYDTMVREVYKELIEKYKAEGKDYSRLDQRLQYLYTLLWGRTKGGKPSAF